METKKQPRQPSVADLMNITALRHYAMALEKRSVELYITDPDVLPGILETYTTALKALTAKSVMYTNNPPDSCYYPFVLCGDGTCALEADCPC